MHQIKLENITIEVITKNIKNINLAILPPQGRVRISAPKKMNIQAIKIFAISKIAWIKKHQEKMQKQPQESKKEYCNEESHYFFGTKYLLKIEQSSKKSQIEIRGNFLILNLGKMENNKKNRQFILQEWYRRQLKEKAAEIIKEWEEKTNLKVASFFIRNMKTRWGSCNPQSKKIMLNLELAKKPLNCLIYVIVHEIVHLLERRHNKLFFAYLDQFLPNWKCYKEQLTKIENL